MKEVTAVQQRKPSCPTCKPVSHEHSERQMVAPNCEVLEQRMLGNRGVSEIYSRPQPSTVTAETDEKLELETNEVAEKMVRIAAPPLDSGADDVSKKNGQAQRVDGLRKSAVPLITTVMQRKRDEEDIKNNAESGDVKAKRRVTLEMETAFSKSFSDVNIRTDTEASVKASAMGVRAWTDGKDIGFAKGEFDPGNRAGKHLIAHEFAHIAQLSGGTKKSASGKVGFAAQIGQRANKNRNTQLIELEANIAASNVVAGRMPTVGTAEFSMALDHPFESPPPGSVTTMHNTDGDWVFVFNRNDVRSWEIPLVEIFRQYIRRAFSGGESSSVAETWLLQHNDGRNLVLAGGDPQAESQGDEPLVAYIMPGFHRQTIDWMQENFPEVTPREVGAVADTEALPSAGLGGSPVQVVGPPGEESTSTEAVSEAARPLLELYQYLLQQFGDHSVFTERQARSADILRYHRESAEAFEGLPAQTESNARTQQTEWTSFLDGWHEFLIRVGAGHRDGEAGGEAGGIIRFSPRAELLIHPGLNAYVKGAEITAEVLFNRRERHNAMMNIFSSRADFDWTIWRDNEVYDSGPTLEGLGGARTYDVDVDDLGTYAVEVSVSSHYFRDPSELELRSPDFVVQAEARRSLDSFDQFFVDPANPDMPFIRNAAGELELKTDYENTGLDIRKQISQVEFQLGMLDEMAAECTADPAHCRLTSRDTASYRGYFQQRLTSMEAVRDRIEEATPSGTSAPAYLVRASFISRESSEAARLNVDMIVTQREHDRGDDELHFDVLLFDTTFTPDHPQQHDGEAELDVESESPAQWIQVEKQALDDMGDHWHAHNDYPQGTIRVAVRLISDPTQVYEIANIDTHGWRDTAGTVLTVVGIVAGLGALALSPFTGGTSAAVGVLILEGVAAGAAIGSVALSIEHRVETEGHLAFDRRLAMDMLTVAASLLGVFGSFARLLSNGARVAGVASTFIRLERTAIGLDVVAASADVISGVLLANDVGDAIVGVEAEYALRIEQARRQHKSDAEIRQLEEQRDRLIARILGGAAISGAFILVLVGSSVFQVIASPLRNGRNYRVRPEVEELGLRGNHSDIRTHLEEGSITPDERAFLQDALITPPGSRVGSGDVEAGRSSGGSEADVEIRPEAGGADADVDIARPGHVEEGGSGRVDELDVEVRPDADHVEGDVEIARPGHTDEVAPAPVAEVDAPGRVSHPETPEVDAPARVETEADGPTRAGAEPETPPRPPTVSEQLRSDLGVEQYDALSAAMGDTRLQQALANIGPRGVARIARALSPGEFSTLARLLGDNDILRLVRELPRQHIRTIIRRGAGHVFPDLINDLGHAALGRLVHLIGGDSLVTLLTRITTRRLADYIGEFGEQTLMQWTRALGAENAAAIMHAYTPSLARSLFTSPPSGRRTLPDPLQNLARLAWRRLGREGLSLPGGGAVAVPRAATVGTAPVLTGDIGIFYVRGSHTVAPPELSDAVDLIRRETARQATDLRSLWTRAASVGHSEPNLQTLFNGAGGLPNWNSMPQYLKRYLMTPHSNRRLQAYFGTALDRRTASALDSLASFFTNRGITVNSQTRVRGGIADLILDGPWGRAILDWTSLRQAGKIQKYRVTPTTTGAGTGFANRITQFLIELLHPGAL